MPWSVDGSSSSGRLDSRGGSVWPAEACFRCREGNPLGLGRSGPSAASPELSLHRQTLELTLQADDGSRGWCGPQPLAARTRPLDAAGAPQRSPAGGVDKEAKRPLAATPDDRGRLAPLAGEGRGGVVGAERAFLPLGGSADVGAVCKLSRLKSLAVCWIQDNFSVASPIRLHRTPAEAFSGMWVG